MSTTSCVPAAVLDRARTLKPAGRGRLRFIAAVAVLEAAVNAGDVLAASQRAHQLVNVTEGVMGADAAWWLAAGDDEGVSA